MAKLALHAGKIGFKLVAKTPLKLFIVCLTAAVIVLGVVYMLSRAGVGKAIMGAKGAVEAVLPQPEQK